jgi:hypothetical protein
VLLYYDDPRAPQDRCQVPVAPADTPAGPDPGG